MLECSFQDVCLRIKDLKEEKNVHHKNDLATGIPFALILCLLLIHHHATSLPHKILLISHLTSTVGCSIPHTNWR